MEEEKLKKLTKSQERFCKEYCWDFNAARSYRVAYPECSEEAAGVCGHKLLKKANIQARIKYLQANLAETSGISKEMVLNEYRKMAFHSFDNLLDGNWIKRKDFDKLTADQKACIESVEYNATRKKITSKDPNQKDKIEVTVEWLKIKLYDKNKALENINKMLGFNSPDKLEVKAEGTTIIKVGYGKEDDPNPTES